MPAPSRPITPSGVETIDDWEVSGVTDTGEIRGAQPGSPQQAPPIYTAAMPSDSQSGSGRNDGGATARKALAKIDELGRRFDAHASTITKRFEEHAKEDREQFSKIDAKLNDQNEVLATLREQSASQSASSAGFERALDGLTSELRHRRELDIVSTTTTSAIQVVERTAALDDTKDARATKRKLVVEWSKVLAAGIAAGIGALITAVATGKISL